jgi:hypothetical protein
MGLWAWSHDIPRWLLRLETTLDSELICWLGTNKFTVWQTAEKFQRGAIRRRISRGRNVAVRFGPVHENKR